MGALELSIVAPAHGTVFKKSDRVVFQGAPATASPEFAGALYYRWYSGLHEASQDEYSLHRTPLSDPAVALSEPPANAAPSPDAHVLAERLSVGTHAVTFAATDQAGEDAASLKAVRHGGVTGGSPSGHAQKTRQTPCVIHVLRAAFVPPTGPGTLSRAHNAIEVDGPTLWADEKYQLLNRVGYRFVFTSQRDGHVVEVGPGNSTAGAAAPPGGRRDIGHWEVPNPGVRVLRYTEPLPPDLTDGLYTLVLRVEHVDDPTKVYDQSDPVTVDIGP